MFTLDSSLHFILDDNENFHCTDSLLTLNTDGYIWHELRRADAAQNILLIGTSEAGIRINVFDSASGQFLIPPKRGFFLFARQEVLPERIGCRSHTPADADMTESELLGKLLSAARGADRKTTLVFTHDAFTRLCRAADRDGASQFRNRSDKCRILIRLPAQPEQLDALLAEDFRDCDLLRKAYDWLDSVRTNAQSELLSAMHDILGSRLLTSDPRQEEMLNLLLKQALADPDTSDTLEALQDQALYLDVCRRHRVGLLRPDNALEQFTPYSRRILEEKLRNSDFRQDLRSRTAAFRAKHPMLPLRAALEMNLPDADPPFPVYTDDLALKVMTLSLPRICTRKDEWEPVLHRIKRNLTALWNRPRNPGVIDAAKALCIHAQMAIGSRNWITMEEILTLLDFFSTQICAGEDRNEVLKAIRDDGDTIIRLSNYLFRANPFVATDGFTETAQSGIAAADRARLDMLKSHVYSSIRLFDRPNVDDKALTDKILTDRVRIYQEIEKSTDLIAQQDREAEIKRREAELRNQYSYGSDVSMQPEDISPQEPIDPDAYWRQHLYE